MKPDRRGSWYLLTGAVLGVAMGLVYSWLISPVKYVDAPPYALRADYKDDYRALVALAYMYSSDLLRAEGRLAQLKDDNIAQTLAIQAQLAVVEGRPQAEVQSLNDLAIALGGGIIPGNSGITPAPPSTSIPATSQFSPTPLIMETAADPATPLQLTPTSMNVLLQISTNTPQPTPTATPSSTPGVPFVLQETHMVCDINQPSPLIQVELRDAAGQPVPSVEVLVTWQSGQDHFYTGLHPEFNLGYGDFEMTPEVIYSIHLADGGQAVRDLVSSECVADDGSHYWGSWYLVFVQP